MTKSFFSLLLAGALLTSMAGISFADERSDAEMMFRDLAQSDNVYVAELAQENLDKLAAKEALSRQVKVVVPLLSRKSRSLAVPTMLNKHVMATFLVDTGATFSVITPRIAKKLKVKVTSRTPRVRIRTANGIINAPKVIIPSMMIGGVEVNNVEAIIQPLGNDLLLAGLLGMNFFKDMELSVRSDRLILRFDKPIVSAHDAPKKLSYTGN